MVTGVEEIANRELGPEVAEMPTHRQDLPEIVRAQRKPEKICRRIG